MEWRIGPDMTEVRVLCIPLEINDGGGSLLLFAGMCCTCLGGQSWDLIERCMWLNCLTCFWILHETDLHNHYERVKSSHKLFLDPKRDKFYKISQFGPVQTCPVVVQESRTCPVAVQTWSGLAIVSEAPTNPCRDDASTGQAAGSPSRSPHRFPHRS